MTGARSRGVLTSVLLGALLWHCSLDSNGLGPMPYAGTGGSGPAGAPGGGASGMPNGSGGSGGSGSAGEGGAGDGGAAGATSGAGGSASGDGGSGGSNGSSGASGSGGTNGSGGSGGTASGTGGVGGAGSGGASGSGGVSGSGGSGGAPVDCDEDLDEFTVPAQPGSCFFLMHATSKARPPSERTKWNQAQGDIDCKAFGGARLGAPDTTAAYGQVTDELRPGTHGAVTKNVWIGGVTSAVPPQTPANELAQSFTWLNGDPWSFTNPFELPWDGPEPSSTANETCTEMRAGQFDLRLNNTRCDLITDFVLCERKPPPASPRLGPRGGR